MFPIRPTLDLSGAWLLVQGPDRPGLRTVTEVESSGLPVLPCRVPGNFELELHANGLIPDPFIGMNIATLRQYESSHVWYCRRFDCAVPVGTTPVLVFEGLDCFADIFLNGRLLGSTANALTEHVLPADGLRTTDNELVVHLHPAIEQARRYDYPPGLAAQPNSYESLHVRKPPHAFGWDIMPRAVSAGLWRPVRLEFLPPDRMETVWLETTAADEHEAKLTLHYRARLAAGAGADYRIAITGAHGVSRFEHQNPVLFEAGRLSFVLPEPHRWWPRDRGEPALYAVEVRLLRDGRELDRAEFRHGIRTVALRRTSLTDDAGSGEFCFVINGERVFMRGTNWVPADAFHSRDAARLPRLLALADECGCNLIRCWGGNVYEPGAFFDFCDEHGIMVWQDFAMACAVYPQDDVFVRNLEDEARKVVRRLRSHASLICWSGDNECDRAYDWYARGDPQKNRLTREVLPRVLAAEDPSRPYLPSSPFIDAEAWPADRRRLPEAHLWGPRGYFKGAYYTESPCHFASEIGYHGCPSPASVRRFLSPDKLWPPGNDEWLLHATSPIPGVDLWDYRVELMCRQLRGLFGTLPNNLEDFAWQSQCVQAEALKFFIELFRGAKWRRTGILWWNLIDGWPQFSDAIVDYYFEKKLAFDFIRRAQQPLLVMLREPRGETQELVACNDTREPASLVFTAGDADSGETLAAGQATAAADAVTVLATLPFPSERQRFVVIDWEAPQASGRNHHLGGEPPFEAARYRRWLVKTHPRSFAFTA
jgi:beta-mannosidase